MTNATVDPVAVEIHRRALENITHEAAATLMRTSGSPVIYEVQDFATSLLDAAGDQLSLSVTNLFHAGSSLLGTRAIIDEVGDQEVRPGDGWIVNDPFEGGAMHQGDVAIIMPLFYDDELVGWGFSNVHVLDVGGSGISGFAPGALSVFEEGVRFPPTKIITNGAIEAGWERYIAANVRISDLVLNDMRSMIAANNVSQMKLAAMIDRYGLDRFKEYCEINKTLTENAFRERIKQLPSGTYETVEWVEFDGHGKELLLELRCRLDIDGSELRFSFSGAPQVDAFINGTPGLVYGSVMAVFLTTLAYGDLPFNAGMWRPISIDVGAPGTIVNAVPPVPVSSGHALVGTRVTKATKELVNQACSLSESETIRKRVAGQSWDSAGLAPLAGTGHGGAPTVVFFMDQVTGVGGGAQTGFDGQDGYGWTITPDIGLPSVETNEDQQPALYLWRRLIKNSGGPGMLRGGQSMESAYAIYDSPGLSGAVTIGCTEVPPRGAGGGLPASSGGWDTVHATNLESLLADGVTPHEEGLVGQTARQPSNTGRIAMARWDIMRMRGGGGGGLGDPILRDPRLVADDVRDGYITTGHAAAAYGVVCDTDGEFDEAETNRRRDGLREARIGTQPASEQRPPETPGIAVALTSAGDGQHWECTYCRSGLGSTDANWRSAATTRTTPIETRFAELEMHVRSRSDDPKVMMSEHYCSACAGLIGVDVFPEGFEGFPAPRLT